MLVKGTHDSQYCMILPFLDQDIQLAPVKKFSDFFKILTTFAGSALL